MNDEMGGGAFRPLKTNSSGRKTLEEIATSFLTWGFFSKYGEENMEVWENMVCLGKDYSSTAGEVQARAGWERQGPEHRGCCSSRDPVVLEPGCSGTSLGRFKNVPLPSPTPYRCIFDNLCQQFSTSILQGFLKHAMPDYLVRGTDLFSLRLSNKRMITANTIITVWCEWIKITPIFLVNRLKYIFGVSQNFSN